MSPVAIVVVVGAGVFLLLFVAFMLVRQMAAAREREARERFPNARMLLPNVNFFGQQSLGVMQGRGNGTMVLTDSELHYERWLPRKAFRVTLAAIDSIETPTSFLGKTMFRPLLKVNFKNDAGQPDAMAWLVPDLDGTKRTIEAAINR